MAKPPGKSEPAADTGSGLGRFLAVGVVAHALLATAGCGDNDLGCLLDDVLSPDLISKFHATPDVIPVGGVATLSWSVSDPSICSIDHSIGSVDDLGGSVVVTPATTITYQMTCDESINAPPVDPGSDSCAPGREQQSVTVTVLSPGSSATGEPLRSMR